MKCNPGEVSDWWSCLLPGGIWRFRQISELVLTTCWGNIFRVQRHGSTPWEHLMRDPLLLKLDSQRATHFRIGQKPEMNLSPSLLLQEDFRVLCEVQSKRNESSPRCYKHMRALVCTCSQIHISWVFQNILLMLWSMRYFAKANANIPWKNIPYLGLRFL